MRVLMLADRLIHDMKRDAAKDIFRGLSVETRDKKNHMWLSTAPGLVSRTYITIYQPQRLHYKSTASHDWKEIIYLSEVSHLLQRSGIMRNSMTMLILENNLHIPQPILHSTSFGGDKNAEESESLNKHNSLLAGSSHLPAQRLSST